MRRHLEALLLGTLLLLLFAGGGVLAWQIRSDLPAYRPPDVRVPPPPIEDEVRLVALGDWGSRRRPQADVIHGIERAARRLGGLHAGLLLGDNFYPHGVTGPDDPTFAEVFEQPFDTEHLGLLPFYAVLGNHDHDGDAEAQVRYTARSNGRWLMPAHRYRVDLPDGRPPLVTLLALDTDERFAGFDEQVLWLTGELESLRGAPQAVIVMAHHPIASYAKKANRVERQVRERILPLLREIPVVDLYLAGHSHCLEVIEQGGLVTAVLGAGGKDLYAVEPGDGTLFCRSTYGFGLLHVTERGVRLELRDAEDRLLFTWERVRAARR
jgi:hypothetical protein